MYTKKFIAAALLLALTGCAGHDYQLPEGQLIQREAIAEQWSVDSEWWKAYNDPVLNKLVETALERNIDLARSAIAVNKALYKANQLGADLVPSFSSDNSAGLSGKTNGGALTDKYSFGLSMSYEIDLWQRLRDTASAQAWEHAATQQDLEAARLSLINSVVSTYFDLVYLRECVKGYDEMLSYYRQALTIAKNKQAAGRTDMLDVYTAEQAVLSAGNNLSDMRTQFAQAEEAMRLLLNAGPDSPVDYSNGQLDALIGVDLSVPVNALSLRPDVRAAELRVLSVFRSLEAAEKSIYPSITIGASLSSSTAESSTSFSAPGLSGTIKINLPFLQYNSLKWNIKTSEATFEDSRLQLEKAVNTALNEVNYYYVVYENSLKSLENQKATLAAEEKIVKYRESSYASGASELKDLLDAKRAAVTTKLNVLKSHYDAIRYENAVYEAMGGRLTGKK